MKVKEMFRADSLGCMVSENALPDQFQSRNMIQLNKTFHEETYDIEKPCTYIVKAI